MFCFKYILLFLLKHQHTNYTTTCCFVTYVFLLNNKLNKANKFVDFVIKLCVYRVIPLNINLLQPNNKPENLRESKPIQPSNKPAHRIK